jgi:Big-like domain-containing protein
MKAVLAVSCVVLLCLGCDESPPVAPTPSAPALTALFLSFSGGGTNSEGELPVGRNVQFRALARFADGSGQTLTADALTWTTANANVATVSSTGVVQGVAPGITGITATFHGVAGSLNVVVVL